MNAPAVVPMREKLAPIPAQLHQWANDMDAGRIPIPAYMLFVTETDNGYELRGVGEINNMRAAYMLLRALEMVAT